MEVVRRRAMQCPIYQEISPLFEGTSTILCGREPKVNKTALAPAKKEVIPQTIREEVSAFETLLSLPTYSIPC